MADGLGRFFADSGCFASASLRRLPGNAKEVAQETLTEARAGNQKVVLIAVRELGPLLRLGSSAALFEGATEVVLDISEYEPSAPLPRTFTVQWRNGGAGVLKGVATLPSDMQEALAAGLQPAAR